MIWRHFDVDFTRLNRHQNLGYSMKGSGVVLSSSKCGIQLLLATSTLPEGTYWRQALMNTSVSPSGGMYANTTARGIGTNLTLLHKEGCCTFSTNNNVIIYGERTN